MKLRSILTVSLLPVLLLVGCAPASTPETIQPENLAPVPAESEPTAVPLPTATVVHPEAAPTDAPATQALIEVPQAVATSRGPDLEATDPTTVSLNSGDLQFVEFFRFT